MTRVLALALLAACAAAADLVVEHAWARATTADATVGGVFATVRNAGAAADTLVSAASPDAGRIEIHEHLHRADGTMAMQEVEGGLAVPAGATVELKPGGYHLMLFGLKHGLSAGGSLDLVLVFAKAGRVAVTARINPAGAMGWDEAQ